MKNPNGYGTVYKLSGKRRKPWTARKTVGWNDKGQPMYLFIGYYKTRAEAQTALGAYNANPYEFNNITLEELYEKWLESSDAKKLKEGTLTTYRAGWKLASTIKHMPVNEIKLDHYEDAAEITGSPRSVVKTYKSLLGKLIQFGIKHEMVNSSRLDVVHYIDLMKFPQGKKVNRVPFSVDAIEKLWQHTDEWDVRFVLCMIYTGLRIGEISELLKTDVNLEEGYLTVKDSKTPAGIRTVPIVDDVLPFFKTDSMTYAFEKTLGKTISLGSRTNIFNHIEELTGEHHTPHETRHTLITMMAETDTPLRIIKRIVGHKNDNVTEDVYTHLSMDKLKESIDRTMDLLLTRY